MTDKNASQDFLPGPLGFFFERTLPVRNACFLYYYISSSDGLIKFHVATCPFLVKNGGQAFPLAAPRGPHRQCLLIVYIETYGYPVAAFQGSQKTTASYHLLRAYLFTVTPLGSKS